LTQNLAHPHPSNKNLKGPLTKGVSARPLLTMWQLYQKAEGSLRTGENKFHKMLAIDHLTWYLNTKTDCSGSITSILNIMINLYLKYKKCNDSY
jgi:hypothetical protein